MKFRLFLLLLALLFIPVCSQAQTAAQEDYDKIDGCVWMADRWNDGDSFHVILPKGNPRTPNEATDIVIRLYFVDTPEMESKYGERIEEQAAYFGISNEQVLELAKEASEFTKSRLSKPFRLWTRYRSAMGLTAGGRIYAFVVTAKGEDLNAALVANGLARIHGSRTPIPNGVTSRDYIARLTELERVAKAQKRGGWRFAVQAPAQPARPLTSPPAAPPAVLAPLYAASKKSAVFHKMDCASIDRIAEKNLVTYGSRADAIAAGKEPCSICKP